MLILAVSEKHLRKPNTASWLKKKKWLKNGQKFP